MPFLWHMSSRAATISALGVSAVRSSAPGHARDCPVTQWTVASVLNGWVPFLYLECLMNFMFGFLSYLQMSWKSIASSTGFRSRPWRLSRFTDRLIIRSQRASILPSGTDRILSSVHLPEGRGGVPPSTSSTLEVPSATRACRASPPGGGIGPRGRT